MKILKYIVIEAHVEFVVHLFEILHDNVYLILPIVMRISILEVCRFFCVVLQKKML